MRGVGHELTLASERGLGLRARGVQLPEHPLQGARELGDLVVGERLRHAARGVARARDLRGRRGQLRDRRHRAACDRHARQQRQQAAGQHTNHQPQLDALDGRLRRGDLPSVLDEHASDRLAERVADHRFARQHAIAVDCPRLLLGLPERRRSAGFPRDQGPAEREDPDLGVVGLRGEILERGADPQRVDADPQLRRELFGGVEDLTVEVGADAMDGQRADGEREGAQDHERQQGRHAGQAHSDRQPVEAGGDALAGTSH